MNEVKLIKPLRVIMTGCTALQIDTANRTIQKIDGPASVVQALRELGHEVEWRKVDPGEDLSSFDVAWVNLAPINSLNGRAGAMGALWTLSSGLPCVGFFDDWQTPAVFNGMRAVTRNPAMLTKYMLVGAAHRGEEDATYYDRELVYAAMARLIEKDPDLVKKIYVDRYYYRDTDENVVPHRERLIAAAAAFDTERWERGMVPVAPMYAWGDRTGVRRRMPATMGRIEALDLSSTIYPLIESHLPLHPVQKERSWLLAALMPHNDWVDRREWTWPIKYLGAKKMIRSRGGDRVKTEGEVIDRYNQVWGILSPPYPHAGSGWWRSRFMYAARVGSILVCDKGEGDPLGPAYRYKPNQIEQMDTEELAAVAKAQGEALLPYMPDPRLFGIHVDQIIRRAIAEDKGWTA